MFALGDEGADASSLGLSSLPASSAPEVEEPALLDLRLFLRACWSEGMSRAALSSRSDDSAELDVCVMVAGRLEVEYWDGFAVEADDTE